MPEEVQGPLGLQLFYLEGGRPCEKRAVFMSCEDTAPPGGCWLLSSHNFTRKHNDSKAISGRQICPWEEGKADLLTAQSGDLGNVLLDCRAEDTLYKDPMLPAPRMYLKNWQSCQMACDESDACEAYSYKVNTDPPGGCWLFRNMKYGRNIRDKAALSGRKYCKIPLDEIPLSAGGQLVT